LPLYRYVAVLSSAAVAERELVVVTGAGWAYGPSIEASTLRRLYLGKRTRLVRARIRCVDFPPGSDLHVLFREVVLRMSEDELAAHWIEQALKGDAVPPREVEEPVQLYTLLRRAPTMLGYALVDLAEGPPPDHLSVVTITSDGEPVRLPPAP
jgi:hypothetical protein